MGCFIEKRLNATNIKVLLNKRINQLSVYLDILCANCVQMAIFVKVKNNNATKL